MTGSEHKCKRYSAKCWWNHALPRFAEQYPRTGWWLAFWLFLNYLLDIAQFF